MQLFADFVAYLCFVFIGIVIGAGLGVPFVRWFWGGGEALMRRVLRSLLGT